GETYAGHRLHARASSGKPGDSHVRRERDAGARRARRYTRRTRELRRRDGIAPTERRAAANADPARGVSPGRREAQCRVALPRLARPADGLPESARVFRRVWTRLR